MLDIFAKPLGSLLKFVYDFAVNLGLDGSIVSAYAIAIIITTVIFKLVLLPLGIKQSKAMKKMQMVQPLIKELQEKHKNDPQKLQAKTMELYKEHNANPFGSCLPLLIQMPIIIAMFRVLQSPAKYVFENEGVYEAINTGFLWITDIKNPDQWVLPLLAGATTFVQSKMMSASQAGGDAKSQQTQKTMNMIFPVMLFVMSRSFPAGLALYWVIGNLFTITQQYVTDKLVGNVNIKEESN